MAQQDIESMPPPSPQRRYTLARLFRLFQKELKETIRDRRTIMTLVLMPLLVYPILSMALNRFLLSSKSVAEGFTVAVGSDEEAMQLDRWLNDPRSAPPEAILRSSGENLAKFLVTVVKPRTAEQAVAENQVDIGLVIERIGSRTPVVKAIAFRGDGTSQAARRVRRATSLAEACGSPNGDSTGAARVSTARHCSGRRRWRGEEGGHAGHDCAVGFGADDDHGSGLPCHRPDGR